MAYLAFLSSADVAHVPLSTTLHPNAFAPAFRLRAVALSRVTSCSALLQSCAQASMAAQLRVPLSGQGRERDVLVRGDGTKRRESARRRKSTLIDCSSGYLRRQRRTADTSTSELTQLEPVFVRSRLQSAKRAW
jgi:hypothetical protein